MSDQAETKELSSWAIVGAAPLPFQDPATVRRRLTGALPGGKVITTNYVVERIAPATYRTRSGSVYRLVGAPEPKYAAFCKEHNIELDLADPLKLRGSRA